MAEPPSGEDRIKDQTESWENAQARRAEKLCGKSRGEATSRQSFVDKNKILQEVDDTEGSPLKPLSVDWHLPENRKAHHTDDYEDQSLIIRRGQIITLTVNFDREYNKEADTIVLQFTTGCRPTQSQGTLIRVKVSDEGVSRATEDWSAGVKGQEGTKVTLEVMVEWDTMVGRYIVYVETKTQGGDGQEITQRKQLNDMITVLFNPWCKEDDVYVADELCRQEYVLRSRGYVFTNGYYARPWNFGQFEAVSLDAALFLLGLAQLSDGARSNVTLVVRAISKMANCQDDDGVLAGAWEGSNPENYPKPCIVPWAWTGSIKILQAYMAQKKMMVRFGQCWVFSALCTTLCRALGIPTRCVTNYSSAHDRPNGTEYDTTIHVVWENGRQRNDLSEGIWNFHVWNESWFRRRDLPGDKYDGWQAFDGTPQETSEGVSQCGPASVNAIKEGDLYLNYDAPFIFSEVNGDTHNYNLMPDGSQVYIYTDPFAVGQSILTNVIGGRDGQELKFNYKYPDGSPEERQVMRKVIRGTSRRNRWFYNLPEPDVTFTLDVPRSLMMGETIPIKVFVTNTTSEKRTVHGTLTAVTSDYTGAARSEIGKNVFTAELAPYGDDVFGQDIPFECYVDSIEPDSLVTIYMQGTVAETERSCNKFKTFYLKKPELTVEAPARVQIRTDFTVTIKVQNPITKELTGGEFNIEAPGIVSSLTLPYDKPIPANGQIEQTVTLNASRSSYRDIIVNFTSDQIGSMSGETTVYVSY